MITLTNGLVNVFFRTKAVFQKMKTRIIHFFKRVLYSSISFDKQNIDSGTIENLKNKISNSSILCAQTLLEHKMQNPLNKTINDFEFKVFSQWGDDGIIQFLIHKIPIKEKSFVEFGVGNYLESNTRFLLINNNWSGLVFDSDKSNIDFIQNDTIYWKHDLVAKHAFITTENINNLLKQEAFTGEIGLLHIDIDGNDYHIFEKIDLAHLNPSIIIMEYNSVFGKTKAITIPYEEHFNRTKAHYSNLFFGASLPALTLLANKRGYALIGCNLNGNNAYFVRNDLLNSRIKEVPIEVAYKESTFRESRDRNGNLTYITGIERRRLIKEMIVLNIVSGQLEPLGLD